MLAEKYEYNQWAQPQETIEKQPSSKPKRQKRTVNRVDARRKFVIFLSVLMAAYCCSVIRSEAYVSAGKTLMSLRRQETQLMNKNNELKIEVEQLKGPDRIIGLAQQRLGMQVARNNIYVKSN